MCNKKYQEHIVLDEAHDTSWHLLYVRSRKEKAGFYLRNTLCSPYKMPLLLSVGILPKVHDLLRPLKIAHTMLVESVLQLGEIPEGEYPLNHVLYTVEKGYIPEYERCVIGQKWFSYNGPTPFLVDGLCFRFGFEYLHYSFNFTPFFQNLPVSPGYSKFDASKKAIAPIKSAAGFYNECVTDFFEHGFDIIPYPFMSGLSMLYPVVGLPEGSVLFDI